MGVKFPEPPAASLLASIAADLEELPAGTELWRVYFRGGSHPTTWSTYRSFGPTGSRFDHQLEPSRVQDRAVLYAAINAKTCLAEAFQSTRVIDRSARIPWLVGFRLSCSLRLLDLTCTWPTRAGASMAISTGPRPRARRWSRVIYEAYPDVHGLYYPSSMHANQPAVALYERARSALPDSPTFNRALADPSLLTPLRNAAHDLGYGLS